MFPGFPAALSLLESDYDGVPGALARPEPETLRISKMMDPTP